MADTAVTAANVADPGHPATESGFKSSEFVVTIAAMLTAVLPVVLDKLPSNGMIAMVLGGVLALATYVAGRSAVKASSIKGASVVEAAKVTAAVAPAIAAAATTAALARTAASSLASAVTPK